MTNAKDEEVAWSEILYDVDQLLDLVRGLWGNRTRRREVEDANEEARRGAELLGDYYLVFREWHEGGLSVFRTSSGVFGFEKGPMEEEQEDDGDRDEGAGKDGKDVRVAGIWVSLPGVPSVVRLV
ncbi:uncharacterized protein DS421_6g194970 [Arachis hypogaea]|nr:uncharacterized protein DS421_6g194970 [Arachis hypogaea]